VVDHVLRYNPILRAVERLRDPLLGPVQRFAFENDASDEDLGPDHWFWDEGISGGIFVEHGVHFFDAAHALIGSLPEAVQAMVGPRPGGAMVDLAVATTRHSGGVLATFAHGFSHAHRCERQLMRIDFGAAESRITGWIPVHAAIDVWTDDEGAALADRLPGHTRELLAVAGHRLDDQARVEVAVERDAGPERARARGLTRHLPHRARISIDLGGEAAKQRVYAESVRAAMADLVRCARTGARPVAGPDEGRAAVVVAAAARRSARQERTVNLAHRLAAEPVHPTENSHPDPPHSGTSCRQSEEHP
jgi:predicted dehydrogenase